MMPPMAAAQGGNVAQPDVITCARHHALVKSNECSHMTVDQSFQAPKLDSVLSDLVCGATLWDLRPSQGDSRVA